MKKLQLLDLFSGIGGFSLGLERTGGFETAAFCEIEEFPRKVLAKHWPEVPCYHDIRDLTASRLRDDGIGVDAICGGFPCQDISTAGKGAGIEGERSGLWSEYARLIGELRPQVVFVENVAALLGRGLDRVLGDLASIGYDAEWHCIPASAVGAPHRRDRLWIIAHARGEQHESAGSEIGRQAAARLFETNFSNSSQGGCHERRQGFAASWRNGLERNSWWAVEPSLGRVADGVPHRVDRLKALGNGAVPQVTEFVGNTYLESIGWRAAA